jgi:hypothetical protein
LNGSVQPVARSNAEAKEREKDPNYRPSPLKPDFTKAFEAEEESRKHSAY